MFFLVVTFVILIVLFFGTSYAMHYTTTEVNKASVEQGVDTQVTPLLNNFLTVFNIIFGVFALIVFIAILIVAISPETMPGGGFYG